MNERLRPHRGKDHTFRNLMIGLYITTGFVMSLILLDGTPQPSKEKPTATPTPVLQPSSYSPRMSPIEVISGITIDHRDGGFLRSRSTIFAGTQTNP